MKTKTNSFKSFIALSLSIIMILCSVISVSAVGNDSNVPDGGNALNDGSIVTNSLIAHYDFEGKSPLADKATVANNYNDELTESDKGSDGSNNDGNGVIIENGVATIVGTNSWNKVHIPTAVNASSEFKSLTNEMTVYTRVKLSVPENTTTNSNFHEVITLGSSSTSYNDHFRLVITKYDADTKTVNLTARVDKNDGEHAVTVSVPVDTFVDVAISWTLTTDRKVEAIIWLSADSGNTWTATTKSATAAHTTLNGVSQLQFGGSAIGYTLAFDDVKFYNQALTEKQLKLQSAGAMLHGVQITAKDTKNTDDTADDTVDIRFVASIDSTKYSAVGFNISAKDGAKTWNDTADSVYSKLIGTKTENGTQVVEEYTAANVRGGATPYLYALCIEGVPANGTVTFAVTPYYVPIGSNTVVNGIGYAITFTEGNYMSSTVLKTGAYYEKLSGITMYALGDSFFAGNGIGGKSNAWPSQLASQYGMFHVNDGVGGSTIANYEGYEETKIPMVLRYSDTLPERDVDIILVEGGTNDYGKNVPIGENSDTNISTFKGALNVLLDGLQEKFPDALIICITPWNAPEIAGHVNAMIELCEFKNVACINAADPQVVGVDMTDASFRAEYSIAPDDVSHLNMKGMQLVLPHFEKLIAQLYYDHINATFLAQDQA